MGDSWTSPDLDGTMESVEMVDEGGEFKVHHNNRHNGKRFRDGSGSSDSSAELEPKLAKKDECLLEIECPTTMLTKVNPLKVTKWLDLLLGPGLYKVSPERSGKLILTCPFDKGSMMMNKKKFEEYEISVEKHSPQTFQKGIIHGVDTEYSIQDLNEGLHCTENIKITEIWRLGNTKSVVITFKGSVLPPSVYYGYLRFSVKLFIPSPIRCFNCQKYGHPAKYCYKEVPRCSRCGGNHDVKLCESIIEVDTCVNCKGNHKTASKECAFYKEAVTVVKVKVEKKITYAEAARLVKNKSTRQGINPTKPASIPPKPQVNLKPIQPVNANSQTQGSSFDWNKFAAFMVKCSALFCGNNYQKSDTPQQIAEVSRLVSEHFDVAVDESATSSIYGEMEIKTAPNTSNRT